MAGNTREIAFLTNPTAGRGRGGRVRDAAVGRLRERGLKVRSLAGRDADEALDLARQCVADGLDALVVCGGDGMVNLGIQAVATTSTPLGIIAAGTGNDVARYFDLPRKDPLAAADRVVSGQRYTADLARCGTRYYVTVMAAGFDAKVNERANRMAWPKGQMRYNLATHVTHPQYERHLVRKVTVAAPGIVGYADGERFGPLPLTIESVPSALMVLA